MTTRQRILRAACQHFARLGMAADINSIAVTAGVNSVTVYRNFGTKEHLYETCLESLIDESRFVESVAEPVQRAPAVKRLEVLLEVLPVYYERNENMVRMMAHTALVNPKLLHKLWRKRALHSVSELAAMFPHPDVAQAAMWAVWGRHLGELLHAFKGPKLRADMFRN